MKCSICGERVALRGTSYRDFDAPCPDRIHVRAQVVIDDLLNGIEFEGLCLVCEGVATVNAPLRHRPECSLLALIEAGS